MVKATSSPAVMAAAEAEYLSDSAETPDILDAHQQSIQEMIEDGQTDAQIVATLFR